MYRIVEKRPLNSDVTLLKIEAPAVAKKAKPGQFIMLRMNEYGERIPLTIADAEPDTGSVTIIFQHVGTSTKMLSTLEAGDYIQDFVGPLGATSQLEGISRACVVGGGMGCAAAYPQAKALHGSGAAVDVITGFRSKDTVILEKEMWAVSDELFITTDDDSYGEEGNAAGKLKVLLDSGKKYDVVIAMGPIPMMKSVCALTKEYGVKTVVSLKPIMIDGLGRCGGCRVTVDGKVRFACVDGPEFDGHLVDFDELATRSGAYREQEQNHECRLVT